jgi:hypothetical protein
MSPVDLRTFALLAHARREREAGREAEAEETCLRAFQANPREDEARLCAARASLRDGRLASARTIAGEVARNGAPSWLRPPARLLLAETLEREGRRREALVAYKEVWEEPYARPGLRREAAAAILRLDPTARLPRVPQLEQ